MTDFEVGDQVEFAGVRGEISRIDERRGDQADLLFIHTDDGLQRVPSTLNIRKLETVSDRIASRRFDDPDRYDLRTTAAQLNLAHSEDRFVALTGSRIEIEPYQVQAAHEILTSFDHRYLIADEVGLGKTIEAAIVIEELSARSRADRVLIVVPAPLTVQWQEELREKFDREYVIYDRDYVDAMRQAHPNRNVWTHDDRIITSIDFAKQVDVLEALRNLEEPWDVAVFDESHHLTARRRSDGTVDRTLRYRVGQAVAERTDGLLFLTGTPHKGKSDQFYFMISLLDPYRFRSEDDITPEELQDLMIRRLKEDMYEPDGSRMFPDKVIETLPVDFTDEERELYEDVTRYISEFYNLATREESRSAGFAMVIYQKRLVSSIHAIRKSLEKRVRTLEAGGADPDDLSDIVRELLPRYRTDPDMLTDTQRERVEEELETLSVSNDEALIREELEIVRELYNRTRQIDTDSKATRLREYVTGILEENPDEKVLIFTEYTDTLEYLRDNVLADIETATIYGDLSQPARREQMELFRDEAPVMLATDAAREGINLQFAHLMVNYDLPWNPIRIDQRIGRLHRYGQERTVEIRNLFINDTRESDILELLMRKIQEIESDLGVSSDVLGLVLEDFDLEEQIMASIADDETPDELLEEVDRTIDEHREALQTIEERFLIRDRFDLSEEDREILHVIDRSREGGFGEDEIERLVRSFFDEFDGEIHGIRPGPAREAGDVFRLEVPDVISGRSVHSTYERATFTREVALEEDDVEFIAIDHPLVENIVEYSLDIDRTGGQTAIKVGSQELDTPGLLLNYRLGYLSGRGDTITERISRLYVTPDGTVRDDHVELPGGLSPSNLGDHPELEEITAEADRLFATGEERAWELVEEMAEEARAERKREVGIKREHAERYFESKIEELENRLEGYEQREAEEETDMSAVIGRTRRELSDLEREYEEELDRLEQDEQAIPDEPELMSAAVVVGGF